MKSVSCVSPSKAFNIAGLQIANIIAADEELRRKIDKAININEVCDVNPFGVDALITAYNECEEWLNELLDYLHGNYLYVKEFFKKELPNCYILPLEATYLVWIDCNYLNMKSDEINRELIEKGKIMLSSGTLFGDNGEGFLRLNIACPKKLLKKGLMSIKYTFNILEKEK